MDVYLTFYIHKTIQFIATGKNTDLLECLTIAAVYNLPDQRLIQADLGIMSENNKEVTAGNVKTKYTTWRCNTPNAIGRQLENNSDTNGYTIYASDESTYVPSKRNMQCLIIYLIISRNKTYKLLLKQIPRLKLQPPSEHQAKRLQPSRLVRL